MFPKKRLIFFLLFTLVLAGCGKHQKLMKSSDNEAKYAAAIDYYENKDYYRALQLFQQLVNYYQGTEKAEKLQFYYANCYYQQKDYVMASYYFKRFATNYPRSAMAEKSFRSGEIRALVVSTGPWTCRPLSAISSPTLNMPLTAYAPARAQMTA